MDPMLADFAQALSGIALHPPRIPLVSNLTGTLATPEDVCDPEYWVRHVRETVRFADCLRTLDAQGVRTFLELGPDGVLTGLVPETAPEGTVALAALRKDTPETTALTTALAALHTAGTPVDWTRYFADTPARPVDLPTYAFQRRRHWRPRASVAPETSAPSASPPPSTASSAPPCLSPTPTAPSSPAAFPSPPTAGWPTTASAAAYSCPALPSSNSPCAPVTSSAATASPNSPSRPRSNSPSRAPSRSRRSSVPPTPTANDR